GFRLNPIYPAKFDEVIDIEIPEVRLHRVEHIRDGDAEGFRAIAIDIGVESRGGHPKAGADAADRRILPSLRDEFLGHSRKFSDVPAAGILELERKAARCTESTDGRGVEDQHDRVTEFPELLDRRSDQGPRMHMRILPFIPGLEWHEGRRHVGPTGIENEIL